MNLGDSPSEEPGHEQSLSSAQSPTKSSCGLFLENKIKCIPPVEISEAWLRNCSGYHLVSGRDGAHEADCTGSEGIVLPGILDFLCLSLRSSVQEKPKCWLGLKAVQKESSGACDIHCALLFSGLILIWDPSLAGDRIL